MTSRTRNLSIIALVLVLLGASAYLIQSKPTRLGLDLKGGVELIYQGRPTPQVPKVTPSAISDAIDTIRKRTDALGVSEPEIQRSGSDQITIGLPDVKNTKRAIEQVGTTAKLQFYDWEPNVLGPRGPNTPFTGGSALFDAVKLASTETPKAEKTDIPPGGPSDAIKRRFAGNEQQIEAYYDRTNDTSGDKYYLFGPDDQLIQGPDTSCSELLTDFKDLRGTPRGAKAVPKGSLCATEMAKLPRLRTVPLRSQVLKVPQGIVVVEAEKRPKQPATIKQYFVLEDDSELSGTDIRNPEQNFDQNTNAPIVTMEFTDKGRAAFARATKREAQRGSQIILPPGTPRDAAFQRFAITLDNKIVSLATIDFVQNPEGIDGRTGAQIENIGTLQQTQDLAQNLRIGALPIDLKLISQTQVSATLGKQALNQGLRAGLAGLFLTLAFLLLFYRALGLIAGVALVIYAVFLFAMAKLIPITLTLPGIAGLILTLGVAADANIVIFERIKEEARSGNSIPRSITAGYAKALRTIIDANVVTIGVAFILFTLATAGVKGFAFTLGIGTLVSLFTAVLATSAILGSIARTRLLRSRAMLGARQNVKPWRFDFAGASRYFFSMSGTIIAAGAIAIATLGINFGIDFKSGTRITAPLDHAASVQQVRNTISPLGFGDAKIQSVKDKALGAHVVQLSIKKLDPRDTRIEHALDQRYGINTANLNRTSIGPTFGAQIARTAVIAIIASLILISIYIGLRFEFKFAVPVLIALAHDLLITAGVYALTDREVTTSTVAALLTILGYSLYDTIIVFDRIRENVPRMPRATFSQIANRSMGEVLTRSLATSFSTLLPISALLFFGGQTLKDFAFALLVGVASGTYSSIFIATPVLTEWKEREPVYLRRRRLIKDEHGGTVPAFATASFGDQAGVEAEAGEPVATGGRRGRVLRRAAAAAAPGRAGVKERPARRPRRDGRGDGRPDGANGGAAPTVEPPPAVPDEPRAVPDKPPAPRDEPPAPREEPPAPREEPPAPAKPTGDGERPSPVSSTGEGKQKQQKRARQRARKKHGRR